MGLGLVDVGFRVLALSRGGVLGLGPRSFGRVQTSRTMRIEML